VIILKITIIGSGFVGATAAHILALKNIVDEIVLIDILEGVPQGKALDMTQSSAIENFKTKIIGTNSYEATKNSDIIIITAGIARKPGMTRDELLQTNVKIVSSVVKQAVQYSPESILIVVSNPLDAMVYTAYKTSGFPRYRVIGMAGILDTARYKTLIADRLNIDAAKIDCFVIGSHGDTMIALPRLTKADGKQLDKLLTKTEIDEIVSKTKNGGAEIVGLLKTGSAYYAPASSIVEMITAIVNDTGKVLPCCVFLNGEYGIKNIFVGVPVILGKEGLKEIVEIELNDEELLLLNNAADAVRELSGLVDCFLADEK